MTDPSKHARAKREIVSSIVLLIASLVVLGLAVRGTFNSMWHFPHIFGAIVGVFAILQFLTARGVFWKPRLLLLLAIIGIVAITPTLHVRGVARRMEAYERRAEAALLGRPAPSIPFVASVGMGHDGEGTWTPPDRPTLINFWATWCTPCVEELPLLEEFWRDGQSSGIDVLGVTMLYGDGDADEEIDGIESFLEKHDVTYPVAIGGEDSPAHGAYGVESIPSSILLDRDGSVAGFGAGVAGTMRLMREAETLAAGGVR